MENDSAAVSKAKGQAYKTGGGAPPPEPELVDGDQIKADPRNVLSLSGLRPVRDSGSIVTRPNGTVIRALHDNEEDGEDSDGDSQVLGQGGTHPSAWIPVPMTNATVPVVGRPNELVTIIQQAEAEVNFDYMMQDVEVVVEYSDTDQWANNSAMIPTPGTSTGSSNEGRGPTAGPSRDANRVTAIAGFPAEVTTARPARASTARSTSTSTVGPSRATPMGNRKPASAEDISPAISARLSRGSKRMAPVTSSLEKADDMIFQVYEQEKIGREKVLKMEYQKHRLEAIAAQEKAKAEKAISAYWRQKNIDEAYQRRGEPLPPFTPPVMANSADNLQLDNILVESDEDSNAERNVHTNGILFFFSTLDQGCGSAFIICGSGSSCLLNADPDPAVF